MAKIWNFDDKILPEDCARWDGMSETLENHNSHISWMLINKLDKTGTAVKAKKLTPGFSINNKQTDGTVDINIDSHDVGSYTQNETDAKIDALKNYLLCEIENQSAEWFGTLEEYEALETKDNKTIYYIHD